MATFNINAVDRRIQYTSTGQTAFNFSFQVNASSELQVYIDDTLKTETTHYSVSLNTDGTGTVTFNSATTSGEIIKDISLSINNKVKIIEVESNADVIRVRNELIATTVPLIFLSIT